jgi:hypothetical protein
LREKVSSDLKDDDEFLLVKNPGVDALNVHQLRRSVIPTLTGTARRDADERVKRLSVEADRKLTLDIIDRLTNETYHNVLYTEAAMVSAMDEGPASASVQDLTENVLDIMGDPSVTKIAGSTSNTSQGQVNVLKVDKFFEHEILLFKSPILLGNDLDTFLRVWDLYTLNPAVRAKLRNYAYIRGDMVIKIVISGTPFHMGKLMVSYQPYDKWNETLSSYLVSLTYNNDLRLNLMGYLSQAPGAITMDMKDNKPVVIRCPFISTKPMHRIYNNASTAISDVTSFTDLYNAGALYLMMLNTPDCVSDASSNLSISVYGHMENVELGCISGTIAQITTEADEYKTGPIETVSTKLAEISSALTRVPDLAPFAYASKMLFTGAAKVAAIYGWSKPPVDPKPMFVKNNPYTNGAHTIGYETNFKLSLDPKQEITVDPRVAGVSQDELSIASLCARESFVTKFNWTVANVAMTPIYKILVSPWIVRTATHGTPTRTFVQPSAMAFAVQPFQYWRGDIDYRFDFVCTAFHRGKVAIYYEPNISQSVLINANLSLNKQFIAMIDLQETQSVRVTVKWAASRAWLKVASGAEGETISAMLPLDPGYFNGYIAVVPITRLTSPLEKTIDVNLWVKSDNMQVNFVTEANLPTERKIFTEAQEIHPIGVTQVELNKSSASQMHINEEHFGENPISFRLLLKRFASIGSGSYTTSAGAVHVLSLVKNNIPKMQAAYSTAPSSQPIPNLLTYLRYAFLGIRGGVRFRWRFLQNMNTDMYKFAVVSNDSPSTDAADSVTDTTTVGATIPSRIRGTVAFNFNNNAGIEYEIPFYTNNLFVFSFHAKLDGGQNTTDDDMEVYWTRTHTVAYFNANASTRQDFDVEVASGEDFSLLRFSGAPYYSHT